MNARIRRYSTTIWKPKTVVCVKLFQAGDVGGRGCAFDDTMTWVAARIEPMPNVAMNEFTLSLTTMRALTQPIRTAMTTPAAIAGTTAQWCWFIWTMTKMPTRLAVAPTDRS